MPSALARSVGLSGSDAMPASLLTANIKASRNVCYQLDVTVSAKWQTADMNFIRYWREARGLTLQALGEAIEPPASAGTIHTYESGARDVSLRRLGELARVLEVKPGKLLDGPTRLPTENELAAMLELAQTEIEVGVSLGDYPSAVASSLHEQLLLFVGERSNGPAENKVRGSSPAVAAQSRRPTKRVARG